jgi:hypothetical protein
VPPTDEFTRTGQSNGARRRPRSRRATTREDDRPRGFEPDRMQRLWSDIDRSRDNLGLGPEAAAPSSWSVGGLMRYATELATEAIGTVVDTLTTPARLVATPGRVLTAPTRLLTAPTRAIGDAVPCMRRLPIVGGFFAQPQAKTR